MVVVEDVDVAPEDSPSLDQGILEILGNDPSQEKSAGENLHKDIAPRWNHILANGLSKETKSDLLKTYLPPENCSNMKVPKLNPEIKAALTEVNAKKDVFSQSKQNQISSCLAALGAALSVALSNTETFNEQLIKPLSDAARLLCDVYYRESQSRRYAIINTLNKEMRETIKNTKTDEFLFGSELSEHLKSSRAISKSGSELKFNTTKAPTVQAANPRKTLNAKGGPRAPAAEPRANYPTGPRRPPPPPPPPPPRDRRRYAAGTSARSSYTNSTRPQRGRRY